MPGNLSPRAASVHPFHRSGAITDEPRPDRRVANEQQGQSGNGEQEPAPLAQGLQPVLAAGLADFLWVRQEQEQVLDQLPSSTAGRTRAPENGIWRDQRLAEIEDLAGKLKEKVARYSSLRAAQSSVRAAEQANETAVAWIHDALEDIAATALGIEMASRKLFVQASAAREQDSQNEPALEKSAGTAE